MNIKTRITHNGNTAVFLRKDILKVGKISLVFYKFLLNKNGKKSVIWVTDKRPVKIVLCNKYMKPSNIIFEVKTKSLSYIDVLKFALVSNKMEMFKELNKLNLNKKMQESLMLTEDDNEEDSDNKKFFEKMQKLSLIAGVAVSLFTVFFFFTYYYTFLKYKVIEIESTSAEKQLDKILFKNQDLSKNAFRHYSEMYDYLSLVIDNKRNGVLIGGPPGTGKTYTLRKFFYSKHLKYGKDYEIIKGSGLDIEAVYEFLFKNRNRIVVFDDFDKPLLDKEIVNLLKAATDKYEIRMLSLIRKSIVSTRGASNMTGAPDKFKYNGKIVIVTNLPESRIDTSLKSRIGYVKIDFNLKQMVNIIDGIIPNIYPHVSTEIKREVLDFLMDYYSNHAGKKLSIREYINAVDIRIVYPSKWKDILVKTL